MLSVYRRELKSYFLSPIGYAFMGFFLIVSGIFFTIMNIFSQSARFSSALGNLSFIFMVLVPILTMRLMSEERKNKTDQMLLTAPLSITGIVVGKYLAALTVFLLTLIVTLIYPIILTSLGAPGMAEIVGGYIGFFLMGAVFVAIGLFMSALSESQVTAAGSTFAVLLIMYVLDMLIPSISAPWLSTILGWLSVFSRFETFTVGVLSLSPVIYYVSFAALFVFLAIRATEKRRWSKG